MFPSTMVPHGDAPLPAVTAAGRPMRRTNGPLRSAERKSGSGATVTATSGLEKSASAASVDVVRNGQSASHGGASPYVAGGRRPVGDVGSGRTAHKSSSLATLHRPGSVVATGGTPTHWANGGLKPSDESMGYSMPNLTTAAAVSSWEGGVSGSVTPSKWVADDAPGITTGSGLSRTRSGSGNGLGVHSRAHLPGWGGSVSTLAGTPTGSAIPTNPFGSTVAVPTLPAAGSAAGSSDGRSTSPIVPSPVSGGSRYRPQRAVGAINGVTTSVPAIRAADTSVGPSSMTPSSGRGRRQLQPFHSTPPPGEVIATTAPPETLKPTIAAAKGPAPANANRHSLSPASTSSFSILEPVNVTVGPRSGLTAKPGDVSEIVCDMKDSNEPYIRAVGDSLRNVHCIASISWRGHNPTLFKINQDRMIVAMDATTGSLLVAVFDGHGQNGHKVSEYMLTYYPTRLFQDRRFASAPVEAMTDVLGSVEDQLIRESGIDTSLSGSTAVVCVLRGDDVHCINVGDSRAVLGHAVKGKLHPIQLSVDHKPDVPSEKARILAAGGRVLATKNKMNPNFIGPMRVWLKDIPAPGLAMSRALCDMVAKTAGVISTPHRVSKSTKEGPFKVLVIASDGLWDFVPNEEVVAIASQAPDARTAAHTLVRTARTRWLERTACSDDTTIIVVTLG